MNVPLPKQPLCFQISKKAQAEIRKLAEKMYTKYNDVHNYKFRRWLFIEAAKLPIEILNQLVIFKEAFGYEEYGTIVLKGFWDVNQELIGETPERWEEVKGVSPEVQKELMLMSFGFALAHGAIGSTPMQWKCQRNGGGLVHSVIPDKLLKFLQVGSGSATDLSIHTEDAFLLYPAEFISLFWVRNYEQVPSYLYSLRSTDWEKNECWEKILRKPIFTFRPDANYKLSNKAIELCDTKKMPIIFGNELHPFFRSDYVEMAGNQKSEEASSAIEWLESEMQANVYSDFVPEAGDFLLVNNKMVGHGRGKFNAGIDPNKNPVNRRWMLRMMSHTSAIQTNEFREAEEFIIREFIAGLLYKDFDGKVTRR